jgi:hypothetical protein
MNASWTRLVAAAAALVVAACSNASPAQPSPGTLLVTLAPSALACSPSASAPCTVYVEAVVQNASGEVSYAWSGCGSGTTRSTTCSVEQPGQQLTVAVDVTDGAGRTVRASGTATGNANLPPNVTITDSVLWESWNATAGGGSFEVVARINDPESGPGDCGLGPDRRTVTASGICASGYSRCIGALDIGALKTAASGMCVLTLTAWDQWGAIATTTKTFTLPHK